MTRQDRKTTSCNDDLVLLGEFGRAQGLRGEVRLKSYTEVPAAIGTYAPLVTKDGQTIRFRTLRLASGRAKDIFVAQVEGVTTREQAEVLNRMQVFMSRELLPPPSDSDEFFLTDLIGLRVLDQDGKVIGSVLAVPNFGGGDLLEIKQDNSSQSFLIPFTKSFVPSVDLVLKHLTIAYDAEQDEPTPQDSEP